LLFFAVKFTPNRRDNGAPQRVEFAFAVDSLQKQRTATGPGKKWPVAPSGFKPKQHRAIAAARAQ
jgi:hypothetical protein